MHVSLPVSVCLWLCAVPAGHAAPAAEPGADAPALRQLARDHELAMAYERAVPLYQRRLQIIETARGPAHPEVASALIDLGRAYEGMWAYERAEPVLARAVDLLSSTLGEGHPRVIQALTDLGILHRQIGALGRAEEIFLRVLRSREARAGRDHPQVASAITNLALIREMQGRYEIARTLYERALAIREVHGGAADLGRALIHLGRVEEALGAHENAEMRYERALGLLERSQPADDPQIGEALLRLASVSERAGSPARAESLLRRGARILESALSVRHPRLWAAIDNLAAFYERRGDLYEAEAEQRRAISLREACLGPSHPEVGQGLERLARVLRRRGEEMQALTLLRRAFLIAEHVLRRAHVGLSDPHLSGLLSSMSAQAEMVYQEVARGGDGAKERLALAMTLLYKARMPNLDDVAEELRALPQLSPEARRRAEAELAELRLLRGLLARLLYTGPGALGRERYLARIAEAEEQARRIEDALGERLPLVRDRRDIPGPEEIVERVAQALRPEEALVEVVTYRPGVLREDGTSSGQGERYLALVLLGGGGTRHADLGEVEEIDSLLGNGPRLFRRLTKRLMPALGGREALVLSLSGRLAGARLVPPPGTRGPRITHVTSGRELLRRAPIAGMALSMR